MVIGEIMTEKKVVDATRLVNRLIFKVYKILVINVTCI